MLSRWIKILITICLTLVLGQNISIAQVTKIEPPFWYKGMENDTLLLLVYGKNISDSKVKIRGNCVRLLKIIPLESANYLGLQLIILDKSDSIIQFIFNGKEQVNYVLKELSIGKKKTIRPSDNMYLITPDRFANGNSHNDNIENYRDTANRSVPKGRHGGDIAGMRKHIPYLDSLGVTAVWINPMLENNQTRESYHGYSCTDFYKIDPRYGTLEEYQNLSKELSQRNIKLIKDVVYNHLGSEHPWLEDLPSKEWFNFHDSFTSSNYRAVALNDPHASDFDKKKFNDGWFVPTMPDINQRNEFVSTYLIQNTLWWIETANLAGLRIDTYAYSDNDFMRKLAYDVKRQYPDCFLLGEVWEIGDAAQAWFAPNRLDVPNQGVDGITDYQLYFAMWKWMNEAENWSEGLGRIYYTLAADILYTRPNELVTFVDNHDQDRVFGKLKGDLQKWMQVNGFLMTTRGVPCVYYGTELLFKETGDHGLLRQDFPGGWEGDTVNKFNIANLEGQEKLAYDFIHRLFQYRKSNPALFEGGLIHFAPENGIYVYFRTSEKKTLIVVLSNSEKDQVLDLKKYAELLPEKAKMTDVFTGVSVPYQNLQIKPKSIFIAEF